MKERNRERGGWVACNMGRADPFLSLSLPTDTIQVEVNKVT